jgi:phosphoribosylamine--glycine ligase
MTQAMKILVIGSGGREHALAWKLAQSPRVSEVLVAPGNAGTATEARCRNIDIAVDDVPGLLWLAQTEGVDFTVVGPEAPLALGVVDAFQAADLRIFGPRRNAAQLRRPRPSPRISSHATGFRPRSTKSSPRSSRHWPIWRSAARRSW